MNLRLLVAVAAVLLPMGSAWAQPPLEAYGKLPRVENVSLSPSGERLAMIGVMNDQRTLIAASVDGKPLLRAPIGDVKVRDISWAGDGRVLATYSQTATLSPDFIVHQVELFGVLSIDVDKRMAKPVLDHASDLMPLVMGNYGVRKIDGRWYGFFGAVPKEDFGYKVASLYKVDLEKTSASAVARGAENSEDWVLDAEGKIVARSLYDQKTSNWRLLDSAFGGHEIVERKSPLRGIGLSGLGRTPGTVVLADTTGDGDVLVEQPLQPGAKAEPLFEGERVHQLLHDPDTHLLIGALVDDGRRTILFDRERQRRLAAAIKAFAGYHVSLVDYTADFGRMVLFTDGKDDSGTYWLIDIAKRDAKPIGYAYTEVKGPDVGPTRMFKYKAADGLAMEGVLTLPPGRAEKNLPVVVLPHGGPIGVSDEVGFDWWAQAFASRGYAVFQPNYRGSGGYGLAFRRAGMGEWGRKMQTDVSDGLAALAAEGVVDPKRACIVGGSYGGYAALAGVTLQHGLYRCAVSYGGVSDLAGMLHDIANRSGQVSDDTRYWKAAIGTSADMKAYSPTEKADLAEAPILLIHGKDDTVVSFAQSKKMESALKRAGKPVEMIELKGEDHWLSREASRVAMIKAAVGFVEKHNPPN